MQPSSGTPTSVHVLVLSWNRPLNLALTVLSLRRSLSQTKVPVRVTVLDQNSRRPTQWVLGVLARMQVRIIVLDENVGMGEGWLRLLDASDEGLVLLLENDWWCSAADGEWLDISMRILARHPKVCMVKLRSITDHDDCGRGKVEYAPWTVDDGVMKYAVKTENGKKYFLTTPEWTGFTFNPILARREFLESLRPHFRDRYVDGRPLRTSEDTVDAAWRRTTHLAAVLTSGPFRHSGFYGRKNKILLLPAYLMKEALLQLGAFHKLRRSR